MSEIFDAYQDQYGQVVQDSIAFSGLKHDFFLKAKADVLAAFMVQHLPHAQQESALDVGCGIGALHPYLNDMFGVLHGTDISTSSLARAKLNQKNVIYSAYDGTRLPYDDGAFAFTFASCVVHHVPPEQWLQFISEMRRVTRKGGYVGIVEHNPFNPLTRMAVRRCPFDQDAVLLTSGRLEELMVQAGLNNIGHRFFLLLPSSYKLVRFIEKMFGSVPFGAQYFAWGQV
jgi:SAM-dependent methyltransferase